MYASVTWLLRADAKPCKIQQGEPYQHSEIFIFYLIYLDSSVCLFIYLFVCLFLFTYFVLTTMEWEKVRILAYLAASRGIYYSLRTVLSLGHVVTYVGSQLESQDPLLILSFCTLMWRDKASFPPLLWANTENQGN